MPQLCSVHCRLIAFSLHYDKELLIFSQIPAVSISFQSSWLFIAILSAIVSHPLTAQQWLFHFISLSPCYQWHKNDFIKHTGNKINIFVLFISVTPLGIRTSWSNFLIFNSIVIMMSESYMVFNHLQYVFVIPLTVNIKIPSSIALTIV
jgi:hypothetical protein